ncbi:MAG: protein phosphatase 2C domain-containing protein [Propionibacteriaceae bacterium]|nr:protein phosphatase 2C domain-containing protein [Propionibacteriaceae bacterium]
MYSLNFAAQSDVGRLRKNNQDSGYASPTLIAVADGMGGAAAGDLASAVAVRELASCDARYEGDEMLEVLAGALSRANDALCALVASDPALDGMGTTVCGAMFSGTQLGLVHIGDSRGYLLRGGELIQLTHDHSWVQSLIDEGRLAPEQAETHPHRSLLLKVLNGQPCHTPDVELIDVAEGDRIMFCSDGLCGLVRDDEIARLLGQDDLDAALTDLVDAANQAGGPDNITVVLAEVVPQSDELDAREPLILGAAVEREIPDPTASPTEPGFPAVAAPTGSAEDERYAPHHGKFRWASTAIVVIVALLLLGAGGWITDSYARTKYFVGANGEVVAIYRGLPGDLLGLRLNEVVADQKTKVSDLPVYHQELVRRGISVESFGKAEETVTELAAKAERCILVRKQRQSPPPSPEPTAAPSGEATAPDGTSPAGSVGPSPEASGMLSPSASISPYPYTPVDPEEC